MQLEQRGKRKWDETELLKMKMEKKTEFRKENGEENG